MSDYKNVHQIFGSLADLDALIAAAHARGLRVLLDLVPNHTSDAHPWFSAAASSRTSPKRDYYIWVQAEDAPGGGNATGGAGPPGPPPNNWRSFFGGSAWSWEPNTRSWYLRACPREMAIAARLRVLTCPRYPSADMQTNTCRRSLT